MPRQQTSRTKSSASQGRVRKPPTPTDPPVESPCPDEAVDSEEIARLAHSYWEARGCQGGSPEEDWHRAEAELKARRAAAK